MEPENAVEHYTETLIRLPNIGVAYPKPYIPNLRKTRADFNLREDGIIYLCCQAPFKSTFRCVFRYNKLVFISQ